MTKKKTPIQQYKKRLEIQIKALKEVEDIAEHAPAVLRVLKLELQAINELLPAERAIIEQAFKEGEEDMGRGEFGGIPQYRNASDYFNQTFEQ